MASDNRHRSRLARLRSAEPKCSLRRRPPQAQQHTILLIQKTKLKSSRTFTDHESIGHAIERMEASHMLLYWLGIAVERANSLAL